MNNHPEQLNTFKRKVVLVGDVCVGKTNVALRFVKNMFHDTYATTVGALYLTRDLSLDDRIIRYELWDTAGQERFRGLAPMFYRNSQAAIVTYDITNQKSFQNAKTWVTELRDQADSQLVILLCGNKADLENQRMVQSREAQIYAQEENILFLETSAKTGQNIEEAFQEIGVHLLRNIESSTESSDPNCVDLQDPKKRKKFCKWLF